MIYLDSAATTSVSNEVMDEMLPWFQKNYGNAGSKYSFGRKAKQAVDLARERMATLFNAKPENVIFTSGGSEGNSFAFMAAAERLEQTCKKHILVSATEHDSVLRAAEALIKRGFYVEYVLPQADGRVLVEEFERMIRPDTGFVSVMYVNNETGAINPISKIGEICKANGILFHTDCVQAAGFLPIDVERIQCDFATVSAHKFNGPKGVGSIYVRDPQLCSPMICGGEEQEFSLRGGTENVPGIVGAGKAAEIAVDRIGANNLRVYWLKQRFYNRIVSELGDIVSANGIVKSTTKVLSLTIGGVDADTLVMALDTMGVCISAGSACRSMELEPSRTLIAMGLSADEARSSVRISFSNTLTEGDVAEAAKIFICAVRTLRHDKDDIKE